nr:EH signature domain-containing protein [Rhizobium sp. CF080]
MAIKAAFSHQMKVPERVFKFLHGELEATTNPVFLQALCEAYIEFWRPGAEETSWIANVIQSRANFLPPNWVRCFRALPDVLHPSAAPERIADAMVRQADAFQWLVTSGIAAPHSGELMRLTHLAWLNALPETNTIERANGILAWMFPAGRAALEGEAAAKSIEKFLQPWIRARPEPEMQSLLLNTLLDAYGDPRNQRTEFWPLVSTPHRRVIIRWLAARAWMRCYPSSQSRRPTICGRPGMAFGKAFMTKA